MVMEASPPPSSFFGHPRWRVVVAGWFVGCLSPMVVAGVILVVENDLPPVWHAGIFAIGLAASTAVGAWGTLRLLSAWETAVDLLGALREGDYGIRGRLPPAHDPLQRVVADINALSDKLREGRRKRTEVLRFLGKTLTALQNPIFVVGRDRRLTVINPAARRLIDVENDSVIGRDVDALGLAPALAAAENSVFAWEFATRSGRWIVRRAAWHSEGQENTLVMLQDVSAVLGEEERQAWQRMVRVLSHELNNSLTPIVSLADSLRSLLHAEGGAAVEHDLSEGLEVIGRRAGSLLRFLSGYGRLARLPPLHSRPFRLDLALVRLIRLERRMDITIGASEAIVLLGDEDQLGQAFINLLHNAVEAALPVTGAVRVQWTIVGGQVRVAIEDEGVGLPERSALFVPFFTTKPEGSGIGLSLARLIVEAHAGSVDLRDREGGRGAVAIVLLPVETAA